jgi:hypothetical protein
MFVEEIPSPDHATQSAMWQMYLDGIPGVDAGPYASEATARFDLTGAGIWRAVARARNSATMRGPENCAVSLQDILASSRIESQPKLSGLAHRIEPAFALSDLVLPPEQLQQLHELMNQVRSRHIVLEEWGFSEKLSLGRGTTALFSGPAGTGKTMAAEIIAGELGLDLFKIDLSAVVSKYIGETEKNLSRIFGEAERSGAILFFDEADALFGRRSEVRDSHDRYANIEIAYLLQKMEEYEGITILATNLRQNLDEAFTRRLRFIIEFPFRTKSAVCEFGMVSGQSVCRRRPQKTLRSWRNSSSSRVEVFGISHWPRHSWLRKRARRSTEVTWHRPRVGS